ncbi:hypothetical protein Hanom_Chr06g00521481 [Helianthus anomalus]
MHYSLHVFKSANTLSIHQANKESSNEIIKGQLKLLNIVFAYTKKNKSFKTSRQGLKLNFFILKFGKETVAPKLLMSPIRHHLSNYQHIAGLKGNSS